MKAIIQRLAQRSTLTLALIFISIYLPTPVYCQIKLPRVVRDSMILQRDTKINIWGWASKGEKVSVQFNNKTFKTKTKPDGTWSIALPAMKAGGPFTMRITGANKITLKDILVGDVWICAGQSNMVHQMELHNLRYAADIANANYPEIRHFFIPTTSNLQGPQQDLVDGYWKSANPKDVNRFSAVAFFFARSVYEKHHIPIGLINASVGGSPIEAWTSEEGLKDFQNIVSTIQKNKDTSYINELYRAMAIKNANAPKSRDLGMAGDIKWFDPAYVPKEWRTINVPGYWEDQGIKDLNGVVWYRKVIDVPAAMTGKPARVFLGRIVDADILYVNGQQVGQTTYQYPQRRYTIGAGILKAGKNTLVVRVTNNNGKGGFVPDKPYCLFAGNDTIDLKGYWQYKVGEAFIPAPGEWFGFNAQNQPTALYNAMLAPLTNYSIKGFLWYQGESNTSRPTEYASLQPALIHDWRKKWGQGELPFFYVQLPNFMDANYLPSESQWAALRESQLISLSVSNTAMAIAIDLGEWNDIHPGNKKDVGLRLALAARKLVYGEDIVYSGPVFKSASIEGNRIVLDFDHTGTGLVSKDGEQLSEFAIAGPDKKFVWARAQIEGNSVIVWHDEIAEPKYVRYAWADNPVNPNLYNKEGLPASPFRTDK